MDIYEKTCLSSSPSVIPSSSDALYHPHKEVALIARVSKPTEKTPGVGFLQGEVGRLISLPGLLL